MEIERIRIEKEREDAAQKASAQAPSPTPAQAGVGSIGIEVSPTVQDQPNTIRAIEDHGQEDQNEPSDKFIFIESIKVGQVEEAMEFITQMLSWEDCLYYVPIWWEEATGTEIPEDWELVYGPEPREDIMQPEEEPEEEIWR